MSISHKSKNTSKKIMSRKNKKVNEKTSGPGALSLSLSKSKTQEGIRPRYLVTDIIKLFL